MDPNQSLDDLLEAFQEGDRDNAIGAMDALVGWLEKDGFMPKLNETNIISDLNDQIANLRYLSGEKA
jgi:hypothetical protein